jgi:16S rRNA (cytosine1402-N4)-methyltransferase
VTDFRHEPVLLAEVIRLIDPRPGGTFIDCTLGGGGTAEGILEMMQGRGNLLGLDRDPEAIAAAEKRLARFGGAVRLRRAPFSRLGEVAAEERIAAAEGIVYDLGVSSPQLDRAERGMSYRADAPLDLRMDQTGGETAAELLERLDVRDMTDLFRRLGEEPRAGAIARRIVRAPRRPRTTGELAALVRSVARPPATKTLSRIFQALRLAVNGEVEELTASLPRAVDLLVPGGRLVVISYQSLDDRVAKEFLRREAKGCVCPPDLPVCRCGRTPRLEILTKRAVRPTALEVSQNSRARSARLRAARRLTDPGESRRFQEAS